MLVRRCIMQDAICALCIFQENYHRPMRCVYLRKFILFPHILVFICKIKLHASNQLIESDTMTECNVLLSFYFIVVIYLLVLIIYNDMNCECYECYAIACIARNSR